MEKTAIQIESLVEKTIEYVKSGYELIKLHTLDKTVDIVSSVIPFSIFLLFFTSFIMFCSFGVALYLGEILHKTSLGFFIVGGFYGIIAILVHFVLDKRIKTRVSNYIIKRVLKSNEL